MNKLHFYKSNCCKIPQFQYKATPHQPGDVYPVFNIFKNFIYNFKNYC